MLCVVIEIDVSRLRSNKYNSKRDEYADDHSSATSMMFFVMTSVVRNQTMKTSGMRIITMMTNVMASMVGVVNVRWKQRF